MDRNQIKKLIVILDKLLLLEDGEQIFEFVSSYSTNSSGINISLVVDDAIINISISSDNKLIIDNQEVIECKNMTDIKQPIEYIIKSISNYKLEKIKDEIDSVIEVNSRPRKMRRF